MLESVRIEGTSEGKVHHQRKKKRLEKTCATINMKVGETMQFEKLKP